MTISTAPLYPAAAEDRVLRLVQTGVALGSLASLGLGTDVFTTVVVHKLAPGHTALPNFASRVTRGAALGWVAGTGAEGIRFSSAVSETRRDVA